ncbi:MAG: hypothetical protein EHM79_06710 [Geobacter sp.]|nr:MAG: hypothetical protein EHM79_06710 [Geobacter sp.]
MKVWIAMTCFVLATGTAFALDSQTILAGGWKYYNNGSFKAASKSFENAARIDPACAEAFKGLGMSYMKIGYSDYSQDLEMVQDAALSFQEALKLNPNTPEVRYQLGVACLALGDKPGAERQYQMLNATDKTLASQLSGKISEYKPPKQYRAIAEYPLESSETRTHPTVGRCAQGETWNSYTNTCARSETPGEVAERYSREDIARQDRESRERISQEEQKIMKKMMRRQNSPTLP